MYDAWLLQLIYLPPPWGDCKVTAMDSDFFDSYSITACRIDCETRYLVDNCDCRMVHMPGRKSFCMLWWKITVSTSKKLKSLIWVCASLAPGNAPYCTPELYKECADPALGKKKALYTSWSESLRNWHTHAHMISWHFQVKVAEICSKGQAEPWFSSLQISWWRETTISAYVRRPATWPDTARSCPSSRSPARPPLNILQRNTTNLSSTSSKDQPHIKDIIRSISNTIPIPFTYIFCGVYLMFSTMLKPRKIHHSIQTNIVFHLVSIYFTI